MKINLKNDVDYSNLKNITLLGYISGINKHIKDYEKEDNQINRCHLNVLKRRKELILQELIRRDEQKDN